MLQGPLFIVYCISLNYDECWFVAPVAVQKVYHARGIVFPFLHHKSLCPGMKSCLSSLSLLMRESSTTVRLRTSLIMSVGIGCFGHRLRSFSIHSLPHRDTALYLEALASSAWTAYRYRIIGTATHRYIIYMIRARAYAPIRVLCLLLCHLPRHLWRSAGCTLSETHRISSSFDFLSYVPERDGNIIFRCKFNASRLRPIPVPYLLAQNNNTLS